MANKDLTHKVKAAMERVAEVCHSVEQGQAVDIDEIEKRVNELSQDVTRLNLASEQQVKGDLVALNSMLEKLWGGLKGLQEKVVSQMDEITLHQQALQAYSRVANSNFNL